MPDYHKVLKIAKAASLIEIRSAYRNLVLQYHPDRNKEESAVAKFRTITEAYNALCSEHTKLDIKVNKYGKFDGRIVDFNEFYVPEQNQWHQTFNRTQKIALDPKNTDLNELGDNQSNYICDRIYKLLQIYKRAQGNFKMSKEFFIPYAEYRFPRDSWGLKLGLVLQNIRLYGYMYEYKEHLVQLGINYPYTPQDIIQALTLYKNQLSDLLVPRNYIVPYKDAIYPKKLWGLRLGKVVDSIRHKGEYSECREVFLQMGFVYTDDEEDDKNSILKECD